MDKHVNFSVDHAVSPGVAAPAIPRKKSNFRERTRQNVAKKAQQNEQMMETLDSFFDGHKLYLKSAVQHVSQNKRGAGSQYDQDDVDTLFSVDLNLNKQEF